MKHFFKKLLSIILCISMIVSISIIFADSQKSSAVATGVQEKINQIKAVYPTSSYFTASGNPCYDSGGEDCRLSNIPSRGGLPSGSYVAGIVGEAWSCYGFARYCFYYIFGRDFTSSPTVSSPSLGDCISLNNGAHHAIYLREDSQYYYVFDSNGVSVGGSAETGWITDNRVMYEHAMRKSSWSITTIYHASNYDAVNGASSYNYTSITANVYYLRNVATGKYLSVDGCVDANKTNISVASWENSSGLKYAITADSDGYSMRPLCSSSRIVNAWGSSPSSGANVNLYDYCAESSQWWKFEPVDGGYIIHSSYNPSCVLDTDGSNVLITTRHGGTSQIWVLQTREEAETEHAVPSKPTLYCEAIGTSIHAWWNTCVNADEYDIYLYNADTSELVTKTYGILETEFTISDVQPGNYYVSVASVNKNGNYTFGASVDATVTDISSMSGLKPIGTATFNGSLYEIYEFTTDWETARQWCELQGGHLATVTSDDEEAVIEELTQSVTSHCWLGASDAENEGEWKWVTGEEFSYSDWYAGEPNNTNGNENYLDINCDISAWNDTICNSEAVTHFVLERQTAVITYDANGGTDAPASQEFPVVTDDWTEQYIPGQQILEEKNQYRSRTKSTTTSSESSLSGWTQYDKTVSGYGSWSSWSSTPITANEYVDVQTKTVPATTKTVWHYSRDTGNGYSTYAIGYYGNPEYITLDYQLEAKGVVDGYTRYGTYGTYLSNYWWNEWSETVVDQPAYTAYSSRDIYYTYYFYQWSDWSEYSDTVIEESDNVEVETRLVYRYDTGITISDVVPVREGYTFLGWSTDKNATEAQLPAGGTFTVSSDTTLYAVWKPICTHEHTEFRNAAASTCIEAGYSGDIYCTDCNELVSSGSELPLSQHKYVSVITEPTPTSKGYTTHTCSVCNDTYVDSYTDYVNGNAPQIITESKRATCGTEFTVNVMVKNNPGIAYLELTPVYSSDLTLVSVKNGELFSDMTQGKQYIWASDNDISGDGILMTFTFSASDSIEPGSYEVGFMVRSCVNYDEQNVDICAVNGTVEIIDFIYGDANGDGEINGQDVVRLKKYLANYDYDTGTSTVEINAGADANGDGLISGQDIVRLKKYLANYDYETNTSTVVLGPQN